MVKDVWKHMLLASVVIALILWQSFRYGHTPNLSPISLTLSVDSVATHAQPNDCWVTIDGVVYDVTLYLALHPGGTSTISQYCGRDGSAGFSTKGGKGIHSAVARAILSQLKVGTLGETISPGAAQSVRASIRQAIAKGTIPAGKEEDD